MTYIIKIIITIILCIVPFVVKNDPILILIYGALILIWIELLSINRNLK